MSYFAARYFNDNYFAESYFSDPSPTITITSVQSVGTGLFNIVFSAPITYTGPNWDDFFIDSDTVFQAVQLNPNTIQAQFATANGVGKAWTLASSPSQIAESILAPESGVTISPTTQGGGRFQTSQLPHLAHVFGGR